MKFGYCFGDFCDGAEKYIKAAELGYDYFEIPLNALYDVDESDIKRIARQSEEAGIGIESSNVFFKPWIKVVGKDKNVEQAAEYSKKALETASKLGIKIAVLGSSGARRLDEGQSYEQGKEDFLPVLEKIGDIGMEFGIKIALEPLSIKECNFINKVTEAVGIVKEINHKNVGVTADYYHMFTNNESVSDLKGVSDYIWHCHFADPNGRILPSPENDGAYMEFVTVLKEIGYNDRFSFEAGNMHEVDKAAYFKKYL